MIEIKVGDYEYTQEEIEIKNIIGIECYED